MAIFTVHKLDSAGAEVLTYEGTLSAWLDGGVLLDALWTRPTLALGYTTFETGDHFREWYYTDRWYNIFEVHAAEGTALKGWYCNIAEPATIAGSVIACRDLVLDLWVGPDGATTVLDEDEFVADTSLDAETRAAALAALAELRRMVAEREPPFDILR